MDSRKILCIVYQQLFLCSDAVEYKQSFEMFELVKMVVVTFLTVEINPLEWTQ